MNAIFKTVNDRRQLGKGKSKLEMLLAITLAEVILECKNWYEIEDYGKQKEPLLKTFLDLPDVVPTHYTYSVFYVQGFIEWIKSV